MNRRRQIYFGKSLIRQAEIAATNLRMQEAQINRELQRNLDQQTVLSNGLVIRKTQSKRLGLHD